MTKPSDEVMSRYGEMRAMGYDPNTRERSYVDWTCPSNPNSKRFFHDLAAELASNYDIDGLMFDYIRYDYKEMCFCDYCKQKFIEDTGLTDVNWPTDVYNGGKYEQEFMEWRVKPITEIVKDVRETMLSIKPTMKFALAAWAIFDSGAGPYWRYYIGQDAADWINKEWIDYVSPMIYDADLTKFSQCVENSIKVFVGVAHGKIPIIPSITTGITEPRDPGLFAQQVSILRNYGCDGFQVWRYGGAGSANSVADIRDYLSAINLPPTFTLENVGWNIRRDGILVSWTTSQPTTSRVEYSTSPLFIGVLKTGAPEGFHYWDIDYNPGSTIEDLTPKTAHSLLIPITKDVYFRVQSKNFGTATSKVYFVKYAPPPTPPKPIGILTIWGFPICSRSPNLPLCPIILNWAKRMGYIKEGA
jgi:hypothetical protein